MHHRSKGGYQASGSNDSGSSAYSSTSSSSIANSADSKSTVDISSSRDDQLLQQKRQSDEDVTDPNVADAGQNRDCPGFPGFPNNVLTTPEPPRNVSSVLGDQEPKTKQDSVFEIMKQSVGGNTEIEQCNKKHSLGIDDELINSQSNHFHYENETDANSTHSTVGRHSSTPHCSFGGLQSDIITNGKPGKGRSSSQAESRDASLLSLARKSSGISFAIQFCLQSKWRPTLDWNAWNQNENHSTDHFQHKVGIPLWTMNPGSVLSTGDSSKGFMRRPASKDWYIYDCSMAVVFVISLLCFICQSTSLVLILQ